MTGLKQVLVDAARISENAAILLSRSASSQPLAMDVSADAYGHGAVTAARAALAGGATMVVASDVATLADLAEAGIVAYAVPGLAGADLPGGASIVCGELYGLVRDPELRPAMRVSALVAGIKTIDAGEGVSYGYTYRAAQRTNLALVGMGYADGLDRVASNHSHIWLNGKPRLVAGRVAMNAVMLEMGNDTSTVGAEAVLFGDPRNGEPHVADWAARLGISASEAVVVFGSRIRRPYSGLQDAGLQDAPLQEVQSAARATIDLSAYRHNLALVSAKIAPASVMAVTKADAYGHGLVPLARAAVTNGISQLGTLDIESAVLLRQAGIDALLFAWLLGPGDNFAKAAELQIDLGVSSAAQLEAIAAASLIAGTPTRVHLKIDTGLHRNGVDAAQWPATVARALRLQAEGTIALVGAWTHISEASFADDSAAISLFKHAISEAEALGAHFELRHLAASAASFDRADARFDLARIGAFSYGIAPGGGIGPAQLGLRPVMTLNAPVLSVNAGIATVGIGFASGISSRSAGRVEVLIGSHRCPVIAVALDYLLVAAPEAKPGETATLFGDPAQGAPTLHEWADATATIGEEIVTRLSSRIQRQYVDS